MVGAGAALLTDRTAAKRARRREHDDAILAFWAAVSNFGSLSSSLAELLPADSTYPQRLRQGLRLSGNGGAQLLARQFAVHDAVFIAMGRVRMSASSSELEIVRLVETGIGDWAVGRPMPETFATALPRLRELVENLGPSGAG